MCRQTSFSVIIINSLIYSLQKYNNAPVSKILICRLTTLLKGICEFALRVKVQPYGIWMLAPENCGENAVAAILIEIRRRPINRAYRCQFAMRYRIRVIFCRLARPPNLSASTSPYQMSQCRSFSRPCMIFPNSSRIHLSFSDGWWVTWLSLLSNSSSGACSFRSIH